MNKHAKLYYGKKLYDIDSMSSKELNSAIKKFSKMANTRITKLKKSGMYEFSNTIGRFHEPRLANPAVGTKTGLFRTNISGSLETRRDRLQYMIAFIIDPQTSPKAVTEYAKDDIRYMFGNVDLSTKAKMAPYLKTLRDIYDAYRSLGFDRGWYDSQSILTNVASLVQDKSLNLSPSEISSRLKNLMDEAAEKGYTLDDISEFLAGKDVPGGSKTEQLKSFLKGSLIITKPQANYKGIFTLESGGISTSGSKEGIIK